MVPKYSQGKDLSECLPASSSHGSRMKINTVTKVAPFGHRDFWIFWIDRIKITEKAMWCWSWRIEAPLQSDGPDWLHVVPGIEVIDCGSTWVSCMPKAGSRPQIGAADGCTVTHLKVCSTTKVPIQNRIGWSHHFHVLQRSKPHRRSWHGKSNVARPNQQTYKACQVCCVKAWARHPPELRPFGDDFPCYITMIPVRSQWGRYNLLIYI